MTRGEALDALAGAMAAIHADRPLRVGVDGVDCAGKTVLADELAGRLRSLGREVLRASVDRFHNPRETRHRRGRLSPVGYYCDSFDTEAILERLLLPLGPGGDRRCRTASFDHSANEPADPPPVRVRPEALLLFDGVFLQRRELAPHWDLTVFVHVGFDEVLRRAAARDTGLIGETEEEVREVYGRRYIPGQMLYLLDRCPAESADALLQNDDPGSPGLALRGRLADRAPRSG